MECKCIDCPNKCYEYYNNGVSDRAYYEWSIKLDKCKKESEENGNDRIEKNKRRTREKY